jgi:hypothetical protein
LSSFFRAHLLTFSILGRVAEQMGDLEHALSAYENALRHNALSVSGLTQVAGIARIKENYAKVNTNPSYLLIHDVIAPPFFIGC